MPKIIVDSLFQGVSYLLHAAFIGPLIIGLWYFIDRGVAQRIISITFFSMILNTLLKEIFQVPLAIHLGDHTWAFPSGHMMFACTLYLWLAYELKHLWVWALVTFALFLIGIRLCHLNYHNITDVFGALGFSTILLICYHYLLKRLPQLFQVNWLFLGIGSLWLFSIPFLDTTKSFSHSWLALGGLLGVTLGSGLNSISLKDLTTKNRLCALFLLIFGLIGGKISLDLIEISTTNPNLFRFVQCGILSLYINIPLYVIAFYKKNKLTTSK